MNQRMKEAASSGDVDCLYSIIEEDPYLLHHIDKVPFIDTPLHISTSVGHLYFSLEMMRLKPSFANKLNANGYAPIHLAMENNQFETVFRLIDVNRDLISLQGKEGLTPLHMASFGGKDKVLAKFLVLCPKAIKKLTIRKESALHIAVKYGNTTTLKILLEWTRQACMTSIVNWSDDKGNNIIHLAALGDRIEMVNLLLSYEVDMKSKNLEGSTAVDILRQSEFLGDNKLREKLDDKKILKQLSQPPKLLFKWTLSLVKKIVLEDNRDILYMSKEDQNAILVVSVLITTATYQAILSPPDKDSESFYMNYTTTYHLFSYFNTLAFVASMIKICLHIPSGICYALHLVLPLVICYVLLMLFWWAYYTGVITALVVLGLILTKIPAVRRKLSGDLNPDKLKKFGSLLSRSLSMERELAEVSVHVKRNH